VSVVTSLPYYFFASRRVMRVSVCNWRTSASDIDRAATAASRVLREKSACLAIRAQGEGI
jgi:hypothetical protein